MGGCHSLDCWHANLVVIQRRNCVLFIHDQTRYAVHLRPLEFDTQCDRSVQGTLRVAAQDLESYAWDGSDIMTLGPYSLSAKLSERPCRIKGMKEMECLWPHKEMLKLLGQLPA